MMDLPIFFHEGSRQIRTGACVACVACGCCKLDLKGQWCQGAERKKHRKLIEIWLHPTKNWHDNFGVNHERTHRLPLVRKEFWGSEMESIVDIDIRRGLRSWCFIQDPCFGWQCFAIHYQLHDQTVTGFKVWHLQDVEYCRCRSFAVYVCICW